MKPTTNCWNADVRYTVYIYCSYVFFSFGCSNERETVRRRYTHASTTFCLQEGAAETSAGEEEVFAWGNANKSQIRKGPASIIPLGGGTPIVGTFQWFLRPFQLFAGRQIDYIAICTDHHVLVVLSTRQCLTEGVASKCSFPRTASSIVKIICCTPCCTHQPQFSSIIHH
jgi:hypothetical protein